MLSLRESVSISDFRPPQSWQLLVEEHWFCLKMRIRFIITRADVARSMPQRALAPKGSQGSAKEGKTGRGNRRSFRPIVPSPFGLEERSSRRAEQFKPFSRFTANRWQMHFDPENLFSIVVVSNMKSIIFNTL
jgi:hypothetical protein